MNPIPFRNPSANQSVKQYLDIYNGYPTGFLGPLGPLYNDTTERLVAQTQFTANKADMAAAAGANMASYVNTVEQQSTRIPTSVAETIAAIPGINAANEVNYGNTLVANMAASSASIVSVIAASVSAASNAALRFERSMGPTSTTTADAVAGGPHGPSDDLEAAAAEANAASLAAVKAGGSGPVAPTIIGAQNVLTPDQIAQNNAFLDIQNAKIANRAIGNSRTLYNTTVLAFTNALIKSNTVARSFEAITVIRQFMEIVALSVAKPLGIIDLNNLLVTQYSPSIPLSVGIAIVNYGLTAIIAFISSINTRTSAVTGIASLLTLLSGVSDDLNDKVIATAAIAERDKALMDSVNAVTIRRMKLPDTVNAMRSYADTAKESAIAAGAAAISAEDMRMFIKSVTEVAATIDVALGASAIESNSSTNAMLISAALETKNSINDILSVLNKVTSNSSGADAPSIISRASNSIQFIIKTSANLVSVSSKSSSDMSEIATAVANANVALSSIVLPTAPTDSMIALAALNASVAVTRLIGIAKHKSHCVSEATRKSAFTASFTATHPVSAAHIATATAAAFRRGAEMAAAESRLARLSAEAPVVPLKGYQAFQASNRVQMPVRPRSSSASRRAAIARGRAAHRALLVGSSNR